MNIIIEPHSLIRARERGTNRNEILDVLKTGQETIARYEKMAKYKIFEFNKKWLGKYYNQKMIKVFYTIKETTIIIVQFLLFRFAGLKTLSAFQITLLFPCRLLAVRRKYGNLYS